MCLRKIFDEGIYAREIHTRRGGQIGVAWDNLSDVPRTTPKEIKLIDCMARGTRMRVEHIVGRGSSVFSVVSIIVVLISC